MNITIITVCLNAQEVIEQTIVSVLTQSYKDIEFIVIDGGSLDRTLELVDKYRDRISCFISEPDAGIYHAMNKGINMSTGDVLYFLNAGDIINDEHVIADVMNEFKLFSNISILYGRVILKDNIEQILIPDKISNYSYKTRLDLLINPMICHQSEFCRAEVYRKIGNFNLAHKIFADFDFRLRAFNAGYHLKYFDRFIACYDMQGVSSINRFRAIPEKIRVCFQNCHFFEFIYFLFVASIRMLRNVLFKQTL